MEIQVVKIANITSAEELNKAGKLTKAGNPYAEGTSTLRLETPFSRGGNDVANLFLGGRVGKIVAFQTVDNEVLKAWGVSQGDNINQALKDNPIALQRMECTESELASKEGDDALGWTAKVNPENDKAILSAEEGTAGEQVYMKSIVVMASALNHDLRKSQVTVEETEEVPA